MSSPLPLTQAGSSTAQASVTAIAATSASVSQPSSGRRTWLPSIVIAPGPPRAPARGLIDVGRDLELGERVADGTGALALRLGRGLVRIGRELRLVEQHDDGADPACPQRGQRPHERRILGRR